MDMLWPCHPLWRHRRGHNLCQSTWIREQLGFSDPVDAETGLERTVAWLLCHRPDAAAEATLGDPFDYDSEDDLISRWRGAEASLGPVTSPLPAPAHMYRHPKAAGEEWRPPVR